MIVWLILFASTAFAADDIAATYAYKNGEKVTILTRDSQHVRMNVSGDDYMLLEKGKVYSVSKQDNGKWMVMDMSQMKTMTPGGMPGMIPGGKAPAMATDGEYTVKYEKTGKKEQIAGYTGDVYVAKTMQAGKMVSQDEMVFCNHDDFKALNEAWVAIGKAMGPMTGEKTAGNIEKAAKEASAAGYGGMLRYKDEMKLESLKKQSLDNSVYQLPPNAEMVNLSNMPAMPKAGAPQGMPQMPKGSPQGMPQMPKGIPNIPQED